MKNQKINPTVLALLGVLLLAFLIFIAQPPVMTFIAQRSGIDLARIFTGRCFIWGVWTFR